MLERTLSIYLTDEKKSASFVSYETIQDSEVLEAETVTDEEEEKADTHATADDALSKGGKREGVLMRQLI